MTIPTPVNAPTRAAQTGTTQTGDTLLDVRGLSCPLPVLKANRLLRDLAPGQRLRVLATDRASVADFQSYCRETGHALVAFSEENGQFSFVIRRKTPTVPV
ncbi:sulfurtransferase TusA family protein [Acidomonas methanolica]|uniref:Two component transcriptional regulator n=1 Tax=Acidomonas methanolica NBRC 104435 TaxID=1231351 RepID=A0A023D484_ACIMT|nr:sulfurtransferase TusA family protein [Acidomonas methanolica]MBU2653708.1 sulfurtransferase TusA family protein [Acidomonas methanolica]TCS31660.1 tRNA 2-thiouridine synthesizing protein A [Acidomonas methanolica]GAJ28874.1 two component transcriptional regulator [Acidomonas methanolica NBRC 104435]GBQ59065.1 two component response regulator [Acidomonas methanolica]GEK98078.1 response regulator SirA [Acidomonas methanolica NBRC 104435]